MCVVVYVCVCVVVYVCVCVVVYVCACFLLLLVFLLHFYVCVGVEVDVVKGGGR